MSTTAIILAQFKVAILYNVNCQAGIGSRNGKGVFGSLSGLSGVAAISTRIRLRQAETAITSRMACIRVSPPTSFQGSCQV